MSRTLQELVLSAVTHLVETENLTSAADVHAALWPHVVQAFAECCEAADAPPLPVEEPKDRRVRPWQYQARFWLDTENGPELVAETDPDVMDGTGALPMIVRDLAASLHECELSDLPETLSHEALKEKLPQLRNNLGRAKRSALRIPYVFLGLHEESTAAYLCQVDVYRLDA